MKVHPGKFRYNYSAKLIERMQGKEKWIIGIFYWKVEMMA